MPWPDAMLLWQELEDWPPVRMTFGAFAGYKKKSKEKWVKKEFTQDEFTMLQAISGTPAAMPDDMKEAIRWAEEEKAKRKMV